MQIENNFGVVVTIISSLITFVGFIFTIIQLLKTKKISKDAYSAAIETSSAIKSIMVISDLSGIVKLIQEIKDYLRNGKYDASYLRTNDLIHSLIQIKQLILATEFDKEEVLKRMIIQLSILRNQLETSIYKNETIETIKTNQKLSELEVELSELVTLIKFPLNGGKK